MRVPRVHHLLPLLLAFTILVAPLAGTGSEAQTAATTPIPAERSPEPGRAENPGTPKARAAADALTINDLTSGLTAQQLANSLVSGLGVTISNATYTGDPISAGTFSGGSNIIGIDTGVILGTGRVRGAVGPNISDSLGSFTTGVADSDLNSLVSGATTNDAAVLEFDFVPQGDTLSFQYVFSSEEYNEFVGSGFNDVFGFFVNGVNVALIPGTNTPVAINNVNQGNPSNAAAPRNQQFYRNNDLQDGGGSINTEMDGLTTVLSVQAHVNPGVTNHIKLAIADVGDSSYDSNVFIKAGSFTSGCATMKLQPQFPNEPLGATFTVTILIDAACDVDAAEAHLNFDPNKLQIVDTSPAAGVQIAPGPTFPNVTVNATDNVLGRIDFAASAGFAAGAGATVSGGANAAVTGSFTLATITFRAIAVTGAGGAPLAFLFGGTRNTNITKSGGSVFGGATDGQVTIGSITATPTSGTGGGPTITSTSTPLPTGAPTSVPTPTPTVSIPSGAVGGAGFALSPSAAGSLLTWQGGGGQTGFNLVRSGTNPAVIPGGGLPPTATQFLDPGTQGFLGQPFCYVLQPTGIGGNFLSDYLCTLANTRSFTNTPRNFTIRLNQSNTASFTWNEPIEGGQTGYILFPLGELGGSTAPRVLSGSATSTSHLMQGPTCFVLLVLNGNTSRGNSDVVCGVPGIGNIGSAITVTPTLALTLVGCNTATNSGGAGVTTTIHDLSVASGTFLFSYDMLSIPDRADVYLGAGTSGPLLFTTGGFVSGFNAVTIPFTGSALVTVVITGSSSGTAWDYTVSCPNIGSTIEPTQTPASTATPTATRTPTTVLGLRPSESSGRFYPA